MKDKIIPVLMVFGFSMFCGIVVISMGLGGVFTPLNQIGGPIVCGNKQVKIERNTYSYRPGELFISITAYCVNKQTGKQQNVTDELQDVTGKLQIVTGIISGLVVFFLAMLFLNWAARRLNIPFEKMFQPNARS
jgi:hypothetical protein